MNIKLEQKMSDNAVSPPYMKTEEWQIYPLASRIQKGKKKDPSYRQFHIVPLLAKQNVFVNYHWGPFGES
jgi:hypothetical protein